ncbi:MAG TPA: DNA polymerase subunit beta [Cyanothece sp. UBA12306]|nr:DNA polymerase subunit beta [Cyanothece sp. UBA12306]
MEPNNPYIVYWQKRLIEQQNKNEYLSKQARQNLEVIVKILQEEFRVKKIILFGSLVKGNFTEKSDIDLAVSGIPPEDYFMVLARVNSLSNFPIDLKPLEALEPYFLQRGLETGECLYESDISE